MLFNSLEFAVFLPLVFFLYWFVFKGNTKGQNGLIVLASYVFYGWWDWHFLGLIFISSAVDYSIGLALSNTRKQQKRKQLLYLSLFVNLGFLGVFKYYNFFIESFADAFLLFGQSFEPDRLNIILPVGISFYTFQTLSYTIDIYQGKLKPAKDIVSFFAFVSFFPQLVAGPIERARNLLPQFYVKRSFNYALAVDGLRQILWGFFKKLVIADNCAELANYIFNQSGDLSSSTLILGAFLFTFQIYGDFSGYSDIAIGTSKLFGFNLMKNFAFPYFSRDIAEFWRRWHISLSTWFRDYLYIPLGGSRGSQARKARNIFIIFIVSGFWHGANWTFIVWGALNALYFLPLLLVNRNRVNLEIVAQDKVFPSIRELLNMSLTFVLTLFAWIFFRAESLTHAFEYISGIFSSSIFSSIQVGHTKTIILLGLIFLFQLIEWFGRQENYALEKLGLAWPRFLRFSFYFFLIGLMFVFSGKQQEFIYFQF